MSLILKPNIKNPDTFYESLINMQRDLSEEDINMINARLILILANHIGDMDVLLEALKTAQDRP